MGSSKPKNFPCPHCGSTLGYLQYQTCEVAWLATVTKDGCAGTDPEPYRWLGDPPVDGYTCLNCEAWFDSDSEITGSESRGDEFRRLLGEARQRHRSAE